MANKTVEEIVAKAKSGDMTAFDLLYREYSEKLLKYVVKLGVDINDAEDIVSDSFMEAIEHIGDLKNNAFFSTWLHSIAKNKVFTIKQKEKRYARVDYSAGDGDEQNDGLDLAYAEAAEYHGDTIMLPEDYAASEEIKQILADTINSLNPDQRDAVYLYYYKNRSVSEIARQTGVNENTVKSRLSLARKYMERKLKDLQKSGVVLCAVPISNIIGQLDSEAKISAGGAPALASAASGKIAVASTALIVAGSVGIIAFLNDGSIMGDNRIEDPNDNRIEIIEDHDKDISLSEEPLVYYYDYDNGKLIPENEMSEESIPNYENSKTFDTIHIDIPEYTPESFDNNKLHQYYAASSANKGFYNNSTVPYENYIKVLSMDVLSENIISLSIENHYHNEEFDDLYPLIEQKGDSEDGEVNSTSLYKLEVNDKTITYYYDMTDFDFTEINQENADSLLEKLSISLVSIDHSIVLTFESIIYANENGMLYWFDDGTDTDSPYLCLHPYYQEDGNLFIDENVQGLFYTSETGEKRIGGSTITTNDSSEFESASKLYNISDIGVSKDSKYFQIIDDKLYYHNNDEDNYYFIVDLNDIK